MRQLISINTLFVLISGVVLQTAAWAEQKEPAVGSSAPGFTLEDQNGKKMNLSDYDGKIVVLEWLNPDCPFVQRHYGAKTMTTLAEKYKGNVVWVAVNSTHYMDKYDDKNWIEKHAVQYPILDDHPGSVGKLYGAKTTPHMFIIDKSGALVYAGAIDDDPDGSKDVNALNYVDKAIEEIQSGKTVSVSQTKPYGCSVKYGK